MAVPSLFDPGGFSVIPVVTQAGGRVGPNRGHAPAPSGIPRQSCAQPSACTATSTSVTWSIPAQALHAHLARRWLRSLLDLAWQDEDAACRAVQVFGELVTNAVEHAGGRITISVTACDHALECEIGDRSPRLPCRTRASADDEHHRGLPLVEALLGRPPEIRRTAEGKVVAFTLTPGDRAARR